MDQKSNRVGKALNSAGCKHRRAFGAKEYNLREMSIQQVEGGTAGGTGSAVGMRRSGTAREYRES
jgi:hypothetical protein